MQLIRCQSLQTRIKGTLRNCRASLHPRTRPLNVKIKKHLEVSTRSVTEMREVELHRTNLTAIYTARHPTLQGVTRQEWRHCRQLSWSATIAKTPTGPSPRLTGWPASSAYPTRRSTSGIGSEKRKSSHCRTTLRLNEQPVNRQAFSSQIANVTENRSVYRVCSMFDKARRTSLIWAVLP